ncbi:AraC family transcriptional regulator [Catalinimonas niigatensis]|uniref:AraC family transcriptional regulator n=1 Tax=Catalinimonas niigatensis TaxID=1397264 RepID=UPI0026659FEC|nr:AraC family transcriptional regulator [Catalinimonas niigatensis]WPP52385.1 AraC family transcriptional regulator [Catalinimonas niigatensis]
MKPILEKLTPEPDCSFVLQKDSFPYYPTPWHYHPEYELVMVLKSTGKKIIGDHISHFSEGDLVLMGPNLPHVYDNDPAYYEEDSQLKAEAIVIHFAEDFLGKNFFSLPEMGKVKKLLNASRQGLQIEGESKDKIACRMEKMLSLSPALRLTELLSILVLLSQSETLTQLASPGFVQSYSGANAERLDPVLAYLMQHFAEEISLEEVAAIANMSPQSFCRFFKHCTRKTFLNFLNELRVGYACRLISDNHYNISEICYKSGFNNLSNFNRQFKRVTQKTPSEYKREYV